jgi:hypothetical protein
MSRHGAVGADHPGHQPGTAADLGGDEAHPGLLVGGQDPPHRASQPRPPVTGPPAAAAGVRQLPDQLAADQPQDRLPGALPQPHGPEGRHRHHRHLGGGVQVGDQRTLTAAERQVGQADRQVPAFPGQPLAGHREQLALVHLARRERLADGPDLPGHPVADLLGQQPGELAGQPLGQLPRQVGVGQQAQHPGGLGAFPVGCHHRPPFGCGGSTPPDCGRGPSGTRLGDAGNHGRGLCAEQ